MKELIIKIKDKKIEKEILKFLKEKYGNRINIVEKSEISEEEFKDLIGINKIRIDTAKHKFNREEAHER